MVQISLQQAVPRLGHPHADDAWMMHSRRDCHSRNLGLTETHENHTSNSSVMGRSPTELKARETEPHSVKRISPPSSNSSLDPSDGDEDRSDQSPFAPVLEQIKEVFRGLLPNDHLSSRGLDDDRCLQGPLQQNEASKDKTIQEVTAFGGLRKLSSGAQNKEKSLGCILTMDNVDYLSTGFDTAMSFDSDFSTDVGPLQPSVASVAFFESAEEKREYQRRIKMPRDRVYAFYLIPTPADPAPVATAVLTRRPPNKLKRMVQKLMKRNRESKQVN